jgi:hypothetical protein
MILGIRFKLKVIQKLKTDFEQIEPFSFLSPSNPLNSFYFILIFRTGL